MILKKCLEDFDSLLVLRTAWGSCFRENENIYQNWQLRKVLIYLVKLYPGMMTRMMMVLMERWWWRCVKFILITLLKLFDVYVYVYMHLRAYMKVLPLQLQSLSNKLKTTWIKKNSLLVCLTDNHFCSGKRTIWQEQGTHVNSDLMTSSSFPSFIFLKQTFLLGL